MRSGADGTREEKSATLWMAIFGMVDCLEGRCVMRSVIHLIHYDNDNSLPTKLTAVACYGGGFWWYLAYNHGFDYCIGDRLASSTPGSTGRHYVI